MNQSISEEFREKFPCKQSGCDGNGTIAEHGCNGSSEDCDATCPVAVQCQYCFEVRFPMEAFIQSKISQAIAAERKEKEKLKDLLELQTKCRDKDIEELLKLKEEREELRGRVMLIKKKCVCQYHPLRDGYSQHKHHVESYNEAIDEVLALKYFWL